MRTRTLLAGIAALATATPAMAGVSVSDAWMRALPAGLPAAGYFTLTNDGAADIALTGVHSPACGMMMMHMSKETGGMGSMIEMKSVPVPARATVRFLPGGFHLMCMSPTAAMKPGGTVPVTLEFSDRSVVTVSFPVKNAQGK